MQVKNIDLIKKHYGKTWIIDGKLSLRPLSDLSISQCEAIIRCIPSYEKSKILYVESDGNKIKFAIKSMLHQRKVDYIYFDKLLPVQTLLLIEMGFDLFGLINKKQAIIYENNKKNLE